MARLEAASVEAFRILARELRAHGARVGLRHGARRAAADEVRHARAMAALARRYHARPLRARLGATPAPRSLEAMAAENAVEGCVRETYGALVASWQAGHAADGVVAKVLRGVARDETRHAELGWAVARWAEARLSAAARSRVVTARQDAFGALEGAVAEAVPVACVREAGLPPPQLARAMARSLAADLA
ncbi:MAG: hypothetical protein ACYDCL_12050 [Myxococcales bacterium]